jgi:hypothetical protein
MSLKTHALNVHSPSGPRGPPDTSTVLNINDQTVWSRYMQIWSWNNFYDQLMTKLNWSQKLRHI